MSAHARLSPSGSKKWFACPGSITLEAAFPNRPTKYTDDGTAEHSVAADCLTSNAAPCAWVGELIPVHSEAEEPRYVKFTVEMADEVLVYIDTVNALSAGRARYIEQRVEFSDFVDVPDQFGTLDLAILNLAQRELIIGDAKFGHTPVEVEENSQLMLYALGLLKKLYDEDLATAAANVWAWANEHFDTVRLMIYQPKVGGWSEWVCKLSDLYDFAGHARLKAQTVEGAAKQYERISIDGEDGHPDAGRRLDEWHRIYLNPNPNDKECAFCRAMATCPSVARKVQETVGAAFPEIVEGDFPTPPKFAGGYGSDDEELAAKMQATDLIEDWIKAVRAEVERRLIAGLSVEGYGLALGRAGNRKWVDEKKAEEMLRKQFRIKLEDAYDLSIKSPTAIERLAKQADSPLGKRQWGKLQALIGRSDPKPSVKPIGQIKTPYVVPTVSADAFSAAPAECDLA